MSVEGDEQALDDALIESAPPDSGDTESTIDLVALDRALSPIRRVLGYCREGGAKRLANVQCIEQNLTPWLTRALNTKLPVSMQEILAEIGGQLVGIDQLDPEARVQRVAQMYQLLCRLDSVLGLPLPGVSHPSSTMLQKKSTKGSSQGTAPANRQSAPSNRQDRSKQGNQKRQRHRDRGSNKPADNRQGKSAQQAGKGLSITRGLFASDDFADLGLTPDEVASLREHGIQKVADLLFLRPDSFETVKPVYGAGREMTAGRVAVGGRVKTRRTVLRPDGSRYTELRIWGVGPLTARWEGAAPAWLIRRLSVGERIVLVGELVDEDNEQIVMNPELAVDDGKHAVHLASYNLPEVADGQIRQALMRMGSKLDSLQDPLPNDLLTEQNGLSLGAALAKVHTMGAQASQAIERLALDEALLVHMALLWPRYQGPKERGIAHNLLHGMSSRLLTVTELELTDDQQLVLELIKRDLRRNVPMRRVVTGEVGGGRGLVALNAAVMVAETKCQVLIVAPDRPTLEQRFTFMEPILRELGLVARMVDEEPSKAQRDAVRRGEVHVVFGTTALLSSRLEFRRLGLLIAGERDVYGSITGLVKDWRAPKPDALLVTAAPVPAPILMTAYAEWDVDVLGIEPLVKVDTSLVSADERDSAYRKAQDAIARGEQVIVVFPMGPDGDVLVAHEAMRVVAALEQDALQGAKIGLFHGGMSREDRYRVYNDFRQRRLNVLVSTTHFETGPELPGASTIIVEQADRMALMRVHRIRGHIASHRNAHLFLISGEIPDESGLTQMKWIQDEASGFSLSEAELDFRGLESMVDEGSPPKLHWLSSEGQTKTLSRARRAARLVLDVDPTLKRGVNRELARYLKDRWPSFMHTECPVQVPTGSGRRRRRRKRT